MSRLLCFAVFLAFAIAAPNRLLLSYVKSNQVRQLGSGYLPLTVTVVDDRLAPLTRHIVPNVNRANSYQIVESFVMEWDDFVIGAGVFVTLEIGVGSSSPYLLGRGELRYRVLEAQNQAVWTLTLPGGEAGFRLVDTAETNAVSGPETFKLGLQNALVKNQGINRGFPSTSFRCFASRASFPNANASEWRGTFTSTIPSLGLTEYDELTIVDLTAVLWDAKVLGQILVCGIYQNDSTGEGIYRLNDLGLGVITVDVRNIISLRPDVTFSFETNAFSVILGSCPSCAFPPLVSAASRMMASMAVALLGALCFVLTF